jgi:hypothetical protein
MDIKLFDCCGESGTGHETGDWRQTPGNTHRCWLVDKLHVPMRWITTGEEVPSGEKRVSRLRNHIGTDGGCQQNFFFQCWQTLMDL